MPKKSNHNLNSAKKEKNDEFYTRMEDIENECQHYIEHFENKIIYCNCDNPLVSNFFKYFVLNFRKFKLRKLICTCYSSKGSIFEPSIFEDDVNEINNEISNASQNKAFKIVLPDYINDFNSLDMSAIYNLLMKDLKSDLHQYVKILNGNGDFKSKECIELLKQSDIVVTNPPFSLFKDLVSLIEKHHRQFLLVGNENAITYKEVYPHIKDGELWLGYNHIKDFIQPNGEIKSFGNICWFTNIDTNKVLEPLPLVKKYIPELYPKYDKYNAIVVDQTENIPIDYYGVMSVPISFLNKYCLNQFEFVTFRRDSEGRQLVFSPEMEKEFNKTFVSQYDKSITSDLISKRQALYKYNVIDRDKDIEPVEYFFPCINFIWGVMTNNDETLVNGKNIYKRMLIRRKSNKVFKNEFSDIKDENTLW